MPGSGKSNSAATTVGRFDASWYVGSTTTTSAEHHGSGSTDERSSATGFSKIFTTPHTMYLHRDIPTTTAITTRADCSRVPGMADQIQMMSRFTLAAPRVSRFILAGRRTVSLAKPPLTSGVT